MYHLLQVYELAYSFNVVKNLIQTFSTIRITVCCSLLYDAGNNFVAINDFDHSVLGRTYKSVLEILVVHVCACC